MMMFNTPRVRAVGFAAAAFFMGLAVGNYDVTKGSVDHVADQYGQAKKQVNILQQKVIPALKSEAGCEKWRADTNETLALQSNVVKQSDIPADCPHLAASAK